MSVDVTRMIVKVLFFFFGFSHISKSVCISYIKCSFSVFIFMVEIGACFDESFNTIKRNPERAFLKCGLSKDVNPA